MFARKLQPAQPRRVKFMGQEVVVTDSGVQPRPGTDQQEQPRHRPWRDILALVLILAGAVLMVVATGVLWGVWSSVLVSGLVVAVLGFALGAGS